MRHLGAALLLILIMGGMLLAQNEPQADPGATTMTQPTDIPLKPLTPEEQRVLLHKGTERAFTGDLWNHKGDGFYHCKQCDAPLFKSDAKFDSGTGWPSFDQALPGAVREEPDADGHRIEIVCARCGGHLGHVFKGERMTDKNTRHCVNSICLTFKSKDEVGSGTLAGVTGTTETATMAQPTTETAIFASGCFWGTEHMLKRLPGVISTQVGYIGGHIENPTYKQVCSGMTGHAEALEVVFDPSKTSYEELARMFFETHDPTQVDGQGPDIGHQYRSAIFYTNEAQRATAEKLIGVLNGKGLKVATEVTKASTFWPAEDYHQDYYDKTGKQPYCHSYKKLF